ncbi:HAD family hydrolase [Ruegeria atlantica]|uniref:HAD family hydrolase n=1 Tax=Ruegeria atlantica TaxID=81569 RepID=UPI002494D846|nr:HAD family phosphatase [Ruegeria atlantica]
MHDLVIFDCDGVLVDSEPLSNQVMVANFTRHGLSLTAEECHRIFTGRPMPEVQDIARDLGADLPENWIMEFDAETDARLRQGVPLVPGVAELLTLLDARRIPFCVASNGGPDKMRVTLGQNGLWDRFKDVMFSAYTLGVGKPDPTMFLTAARQFEATAPVVIEDSASGVTAAIRANMRCLGYVPDGKGAFLADLGAEVFTDMAEVPALLGI